jgi:hypothetical protein
VSAGEVCPCPFWKDCVAKLPLEQLANRDSVGLRRHARRLMIDCMVLVSLSADLPAAIEVNNWQCTLDEVISPLN